MLGKNHILSACSGWLIAEPYLLNYQPEPLEAGCLIAAVLVGSLTPDVDHPESLLGRRLKFISVPLHFLQGDKKFLPWREDTHSRGITHSIWVLVACWYLLTSPFPVAVAFSFGFVAHLIGDALTPAGVALLWPLPVKIRSPLTFSTGGVMENLFTFSLAAIAIYVWLGNDLSSLYKLLRQFF